jgi:translation initiation factor 2B subunit (eIF-2B alpha/beta/delta family)
MLSIVTNVQDPLLDYIKDDPVRPEIPREFRVGKNRFVSVLVDEKPTAVVCVNLLDRIPSSVEELGDSENPDTAVFYTIWSYSPGSGAKLLRETVADIKIKYPDVKRFITLSPKTALARRFHLKNGAEVFRDNLETVNYEYKI